MFVRDRGPARLNGARRVDAFRNEPVTDFSIPAEQVRFRAGLERVGRDLGRTYPLIIGGRSITHAETVGNFNPSHPDQVIGLHAAANSQDVDAAVRAASLAFPSWSRVAPETRAEMLFKVGDLLRSRRQDFGAMLVLEVGKSWDEADGEIAETIDVMNWYGRQALRLSGPQMTTRFGAETASFFYVPLGVGVVISPWNFPLALTAGMAAAAVVAGNTVVVKPSSASATSVAWLLTLFEQAGLPAGVINYVTGNGGAIGDYLVDHPRVRFVAFTGSRDVGVRIHERAARVQPGQIWLKRVQLEMGGKNAVVVDETADLGAAAEGIVTGAFSFQGQKCSAGSRAIVVESVYEELLERVTERAKTLRMGDPTDPLNTIGPVIDGAAKRKVLDYIAIGKGEGRLRLGGTDVADEGHFVEPTIISDVAPEARVAQEEIFGPVLSVIRAKDFDRALTIANGTQFGLTGSVFSRDRNRLQRARREFHVGNLYVNRKPTGSMIGIHPFGGFNMSGTDSKAGGPDYLLLFLQGKSVGERPSTAREAVAAQHQVGRD
jgi:1-pyrroline-5-carboxylate dehydrogenase